MGLFKNKGLKKLTNSKEELKYGDINLFDDNFDTIDITIRPRGLVAALSHELAQDVSAFHNIDAEAELTALLSEHVVREIDTNIIDIIINNNRRTMEDIVVIRAESTTNGFRIIGIKPMENEWINNIKIHKFDTFSELDRFFTSLSNNSSWL